MTKLLATAFARVARLRDHEQDAFARWLIDELESERPWSAGEAVADDPADRTGTDVSRRLNELFADPELRREQLQTAAELAAAGTDWGDERW